MELLKFDAWEPMLTIHWVVMGRGGRGGMQGEGFCAPEISSAGLTVVLYVHFTYIVLKDKQVNAQSMLKIDIVNQSLYECLFVSF